MWMSLVAFVYMSGGGCRDGFGFACGAGFKCMGGWMLRTGLDVCWCVGMSWLCVCGRRVALVVDA